MSFVYLKSALQIGQANMLNKSSGIGSFFGILELRSVPPAVVLVNIEGKVYILVTIFLYKHLFFDCYFARLVYIKKIVGVY